MPMSHAMTGASDTAQAERALRGLVMTGDESRRVVFVGPNLTEFGWTPAGLSAGLHPQAAQSHDGRA